MAAPTPVSALVHSSTLVTAGVYVIFRLGPVFIFRGLGEILFYLGRATIILAGIRALRESDAKKIVALSTLSQLGIIIITLGYGNFKAGFFHLLSHAFFKALLFMVVGNFIHLRARYQDLRKIRCQRYFRAESCLIGAVRNLSLIGLPFMSGFYSKDMCIEFRLSYNSNFIGKIIFLFGILLTVLYSLRFRYIRINRFNGQASLWLSEKVDNSTLGMYFLFRMAVIGSNIYLWLLFECPTIFLSKELKIRIIFLLRRRILLSIICIRRSFIS